MALLLKILIVNLISYNFKCIHIMCLVIVNHIMYFNCFDSFEAVEIYSKMLRDRNSGRFRDQRFSKNSPADWFFFKEIIFCMKKVLL